MDQLLHEIRQCQLCGEHLELGPRPVLSAHPDSKIVIVGQAPGTRVHATGIPWNDPSGQNLRKWMGVGEEDFYDVKNFAIMPMGFCYPGKGKSGDLPPRVECAPAWHDKLFEQLKQVKLTLLVGQYAQNHYLGARANPTLTETVKHFDDYLPRYLPLPHPSPRNNIWMKKNPWFATEVLPVLKLHIQDVLG